MRQRSGGKCFRGKHSLSLLREGAGVRVYLKPVGNLPTLHYSNFLPSIAAAILAHINNSASGIRLTIGSGWFITLATKPTAVMIRTTFFRHRPHCRLRPI